MKYKRSVTVWACFRLLNCVYEAEFKNMSTGHVHGWKYRVILLRYRCAQDFYKCSFKSICWKPVLSKHYRYNMLCSAVCQILVHPSFKHRTNYPFQTTQRERCLQRAQAALLFPVFYQSLTFSFFLNKHRSLANIPVLTVGRVDKGCLHFHRDR